MDKNFKCGFVAIIGKPNVGKSTLINKLVGEKLSSITPKPQTTRQQIKGIITDAEKQIIFLDTPGFLKPRYELHLRMLSYIKDALEAADLICFITDVKTFPTDYDQEIIAQLTRIKLPKLALLNKIDLVSEDVVHNKISLLQKHDFQNIFSLSALQQNDFTDLMTAITSYLPLSPPHYDPDQLSDMPVRFFIQEIIMEQIFLTFKDEIPYSTAVIVESFQEKENRIDIYANIWLERRSQKPILLGKAGARIKQIRLQSESEIYKILKKRIHLDLWVKIKPRWRHKKNALKEFGYL
jgi:GTP-binding protein Era